MGPAPPNTFAPGPTGQIVDDPNNPYSTTPLGQKSDYGVPGGVPYSGVATGTPDPNAPYPTARIGDPNAQDPLGWFGGGIGQPTYTAPGQIADITTDPGSQVPPWEPGANTNYPENQNPPVQTTGGTPPPSGGTGWSTPAPPGGDGTTQPGTITSPGPGTTTPPGGGGGSPGGGTSPGGPPSTGGGGTGGGGGGWSTGGGGSGGRIPPGSFAPSLATLAATSPAGNQPSGGAPGPGPGGGGPGPGIGLGSLPTLAQLLAAYPGLRIG